ncbi:Protein of unknown function [Bacillus toyonensis]|jgi:hypothetical protein
MV